MPFVSKSTVGVPRVSIRTIKSSTLLVLFNNESKTNPLTMVRPRWIVWYVFTGRKDPNAIQVIGCRAITPGGLAGMAIDTLRASRSDFRHIFLLLADKANYPVHVYCQQGKDRTGLTVILLHLLLEVPLEAIQEDYLHSEKELEDIQAETESDFNSKGMPKSFAGCDPAVVPGVIDWLKLHYGGIGGFLKSIGVDQDSQDRIRSIMLASGTINDDRCD